MTGSVVANYALCFIVPRPSHFALTVGTVRYVVVALAMANAAPFLYLAARKASERGARQADAAAAPHVPKPQSYLAAHFVRWAGFDRQLALWTVGGVGVADCVLLAIAW